VGELLIYIRADWLPAWASMAGTGPGLLGEIARGEPINHAVVASDS
jgi:hypothetical protein